MSRISIPLSVRWNDIDGYGHVNNAAMLTLLEEARIAAFWDVDVPTEHKRTTQIVKAGSKADSHTLIANHHIEYLAPLAYTQKLITVDLWISKLGGASLDLNYEVRDPDGVVCCRASSVLVMVDAASGKPRKLNAEERAIMTQYQDEPLNFRR